MVVTHLCARLFGEAVTVLKITYLWEPLSHGRGEYWNIKYVGRPAGARFFKYNALTCLCRLVGVCRQSRKIHRLRISRAARADSFLRHERGRRGRPHQLRTFACQRARWGSHYTALAPRPQDHACGRRGRVRAYRMCPTCRALRTRGIRTWCPAAVRPAGIQGARGRVRTQVHREPRRGHGGGGGGSTARGCCGPRGPLHDVLPGAIPQYE